MKLFTLLIAVFILFSCRDLPVDLPDRDRDTEKRDDRDTDKKRDDEKKSDRREQYKIAMDNPIKVTDIGVISFSAVLEDSRCPVDVDCMWEGNFKMALAIGDRRYELNSNLDPRVIEYNGFKISIDGVYPEPNSRRTIQDREYVVVLNIEN